MRLLAYTPTLDRSDRIFAFAAGWMDAFARRTGGLFVLARTVRAEDVPPGATAYAVGGPWGARALAIWKRSWRHRHDYDAVFVHMTPQAALVGWPLWTALGKPVYFWYAHGATPWYLGLAARLCAGAFSPNPASFRIATPKVLFTGHGVDATRFFPRDVRRAPVLLTVGRITPRKDIEATLAFLADFARRFPGTPWTYRVVGPALDAAPYVSALREKAGFLGLSDRVAFEDEGIDYAELPGIYASAAAFLTTSRTGSLDKAVLEALACGTPVFAAGEAYRGIEGVTFFDDPQAMDRLDRALRHPETDASAAEAAVREHGLDRLAGTILEAMEKK